MTVFLFARQALELKPSKTSPEPRGWTAWNRVSAW